MSPILSFKDDVELIEAVAGEPVVRWPSGRVVLKQVTAGLEAALRALASAGASEVELADLVIGEDGPDRLPRLYYQLRRFGQLGVLRYSVVEGSRTLAALVPISPDFEYRPRRIEAETRYVLSRFAFARREADQLVLESPLAHCRVLLHAPEGAALLAGLARPATCREAGAGAVGLADGAAARLLELLLAGGLLCEVGPDGTTPEEGDLALRQWEFHDLLFHSRTRLGRHDLPNGGTYRFLSQIPPLPAIKPPMSGELILLERPDLEALRRSDPPLTAILEDRRSFRAYGERPITVRQLGELLYRAARVRRVYRPKPDEPTSYEATRRPYPGGGACYELELYPVVNRCDGLAAGLYHYDPLDHVLRKLRDRDELIEGLIGDVAWVTGDACEPQVVIGITARFQRVSWKYQGMAYSVILKHVGVLYQTFYLVATAMGLGPCGVGGGQADRLSRAIGADYAVESAVGEFLLGSRPSG